MEGEEGKNALYITEYRTITGNITSVGKFKLVNQTNPMQSGQEEQSPVANLVFDTEFIYKAQVEPVRAGPVCGGFFYLLGL